MQRQPSVERASAERAIEIVGGLAAMSILVKVTRQAVFRWRKRGVPANRVLDVEAATDGQVSRHDLRPDIYPRELKVRAPKKKLLTGDHRSGS